MPVPDLADVPTGQLVAAGVAAWYAAAALWVRLTPPRLWDPPSFGNRYARVNTGVRAMDWLLSPVVLLVVIPVMAFGRYVLTPREDR